MMKVNMEYKLKLQQLVSYSRCRIYRKFIRSIAADSNIRLNGDSVLKVLAGIDADVTFITDDCIYTINGMDVVTNNAEEAAEGYSLTYEDYELTKLQSGKIRYTDLLAVKVNLNTDHSCKGRAPLLCFQG